MLQAEMLHISRKKNVHTYVKCPFEIEFFLLPFLQKRLSIETFIIIATGYVHCISFEKSAKKSNDFRSTNDVIAFFLIRRSKRLRFQEDPNDMHSKTEKGNRRQDLQNLLKI